MIIAQKVQDAMHHEEAQMGLKPLARGPGFRRGGFEGHDHVPQQKRRRRVRRRHVPRPAGR